MGATRADIRIQIDGTAVALLRSASLDLGIELVEACAEEVYGWEESVPSVRAWSASGQVLIPAAGTTAAAARSQLEQAMVERRSVTALIDFQGEAETGSAVIEALPVGAGVSSVLQGDVRLSGNGPLNPV